MAAGDPKPSPPFRFDELTPEQFEMLVFRLAWNQDRRVVRLRAPDGGLDTILPRSEGDVARAERGWQAKRHTGRIDTADCRKSLDRAVRHWSPESVTFAFPHDLTVSEHAAFVRDVASHHPGTQVDYWSKSTLLALLDTPDGRRIANSTWEQHDPVALATQMLKAGSPLQTGSDFADAEKAISEQLGDATADYDWIIIHGAPTSAGDPPMTPGAVMRITLTHDRHAMYADCVARHASPEHRPAVHVDVDDSPAGRRAREWLETLRASGGRVTIAEGATFRVSDVPPPFNDLTPDPSVRGQEFTIKAVAQPLPLYGRITAGPPHARVSIDVDLLPAAPTPDWDAVLKGRLGSLVITLRHRFDVHLGRGKAHLNFTYKNTDAPHAVEAQVLRWLIATHAEGTVDIEDRVGERSTWSQPTAATQVDAWLLAWAALHEDLATLERAAGAPAPPIPHDVSNEQVRAIAKMATILRAGGELRLVRDIRLQFGSDPTDFPIGRIVRDLKQEATLVVPLFGGELPVARQIAAAPPLIVSGWRRLLNGDTEVRLVPLGAEEVEVLFETRPLAV